MATSGAQRVAEANRLSTSGQVGGAVTKSGQIVRGDGSIVGGSSGGGTQPTSPKDLPSYVAGSSPDDKVGPVTQKMQEVNQALSGQLDPNAQAPKDLVNQANQVQQQINQLAQSKGLTLSPNSQGGYTASISDQFKQGFNAVNQSGIQAPQSAGTGSAVVGQTLNSFQNQQEPQSVLGEIIEYDNAFDSIFSQYDDFMSPVTQRKSLLDEYQALSSSLGISGMNAELINTKRIIEGTEDDIRAEITSTGGLATDSQVLAMANARNKSLIKNYNYLLESRDSAMTQLNTMMQLSIQDRQFAEAEFDRKMNFAFKVQEFKERATSNARSGLQWAIQNGAGAEILKNPYDTRLAEKTLGIPSGGLAGIVQRQQLETQKLQGELGGGSLTTSLINPTTGRPDPRSQIANVVSQSGAKTDDKLKLTGAVVSAVQDLAQANQTGNIAGISALSPRLGILRSDKGKQNVLYLSALEGTIESWMTGASVSEDQQKRIKKDMVPRRGDTNATIRTKLNALANYMMSYTAGSLATQGVNWAPEPIDFFGNPVVVGGDGQEYEIVN